MIKITKNQTNNVVLTLNEKTTISNANYLLELFSNQNHDSKVVRLSGDTSTNLDRYNQFPIVETSTDDLDNGQISLLEGTYDYFAYETTGSTLSLSGASIIESGKLIVISTGSTVTTTFDDNNDEYTFEG